MDKKYANLSGPILIKYEINVTCLTGDKYSLTITFPMPISTVLFQHIIKPERLSLGYLVTFGKSLQNGCFLSHVRLGCADTISSGAVCGCSWLSGLLGSSESRVWRKPRRLFQEFSGKEFLGRLPKSYTVFLESSCCIC